MKDCRIGNSPEKILTISKPKSTFGEYKNTAVVEMYSWFPEKKLVLAMEPQTLYKKVKQIVRRLGSFFGLCNPPLLPIYYYSYTITLRIDYKEAKAIIGKLTELTKDM
jgi:hypothetical protein